MQVAALRLLFVVTEDWYFAMHWLALARLAREAGYEVAVATRVHSHAGAILESGVELIPLRQLRRSSLNPFAETAAVLELARVIRRWDPAIVHLVAMKPIVYGAVAMRLGRRAPCVNALAGLGFIFLQDSGLARFLRPLVKRLLRFALGAQHSLTTVQNPDDKALLVREGLVEADKVKLIRGAGIDLRRFPLSPLPAGRPLVLLMSRMLWEKGVGEFVEAARIIASRGLDARFALVGEPDDENPAAVPRTMLRKWADEGIVEWWGFRADASNVLAQAHLVVLPTTYREGLPTVLTEASATGRPTIATDAPGCREVVKHGVNGLLVPLRDAAKLAEAIAELLLAPDLCQRMGRQGRMLVERDFSIEAVAASTLEIYRQLLRARDT